MAERHVYEEPQGWVSLQGLSPLAKGRFRKVFVHPADETKCIKVDHFEKPERARSPLGLLRPTPSGNERELAEYRRLMSLGVNYEEYFPRLHGLLDTDLGKGLCVQLIRGTDGKLPRSIKHYLNANTSPPPGIGMFLLEEYPKFADFCERHLIMSVSAGFENLGIIMVDGKPKLVSFDLKGITSKQLFPLAALSSTWKKQRIRRRFARHMKTLEHFASRWMVHVFLLSAVWA
jgi:hypothetical protein